MELGPASVKWENQGLLLLFDPSGYRGLTTDGYGSPRQDVAYVFGHLDASSPATEFNP
jgi:hypothetical protein